MGDPPTTATGWGVPPVTCTPISLPGTSKGQRLPRQGKEGTKLPVGVLGGVTPNPTTAVPVSPPAIILPGGRAGENTPRTPGSPQAPAEQHQSWE